MITPPYLKAGDKVALVAPARKVSPEEMKPAMRIIDDWGFVPVPGKHLFGAENQYSGSDAERLEDLQQAFDDDSVRAVFCARGGYGTLRLIDQIDFSGLARSPKWIIGYSDITVLHAHINNLLGIETLHAAMPINFASLGKDSPSLVSLRDALTGQQLRYTLPPHPLNRPGEASGILTGGNLSILYSLNGSRSLGHTAGKLLFIEDLDEYLYHIDRMMQNLLRSGMLSGLSALLVGDMTDMRDNEVPFGSTAHEIVANAVSGFGFPVAHGIRAGHGQQNMALIFARKAWLQTGSKTVLEFSHP